MYYFLCTVIFASFLTGCAQIYMGMELWVESYALDSQAENIEWHRLFTGPLSHASLLHFYLNILMIYTFAKHHRADPVKEQILYSICFVFGSLFASLCFIYMGTQGHAVGLSGGIMSLCGYLIVREKDPEINPKIVKSALFIFVVGAFFHQYIDNIGHAGGIVFGYLFAKWVERQATKSRVSEPAV
jgi:membrane associated rhomboid family serine protease